MIFSILTKKNLWNPEFKFEKKVSCKHGHVVDRNVFQERLANSNPRWSEFVDELERTGQKLRTNPDGDVRTSDPLFSSARGLEPISNL